MKKTLDNINFLLAIFVLGVGIVITSAYLAGRLMIAMSENEGKLAIDDIINNDNVLDEINLGELADIKEDFLNEEQNLSQNSTKDEIKISEEGFNQDINLIFGLAPSIELRDVSGGGSIGMGWLVVYNDKTYHRLAAINLQSLKEGEYYEGWIVNNSILGDKMPTGRMNHDVLSASATLQYTVMGNKSNYKGIVVTIEREGIAGPGRSVLVGDFSEDMDFVVTDDQIDKYKIELKEMEKEFKNKTLMEILLNKDTNNEQQGIKTSENLMVTGFTRLEEFPEKNAELQQLLESNIQE